MSEEKQIEEIKQIINERCEAELEQVNASSSGGKVIKTVDTILIAEDIYNAGYQKLPEDSVILPKSQYDMLIALSSYEGSIEQLKNTVILPKEEYERLSESYKLIDLIRKETVEKILQIIDFIDKKYQNYAKEELQSGMIAKAFTVVATEIKIEIAKQFGVEIKEN